MEIDLLLVTVTKVETKAVFDVFREATGQDAKPIPLAEKVFHDLGTVNGTRVCLVQSEMGAGGLGAALQTVQKGIEAVSPSAVIMVGIAFGVNEKEQKIGDILVSRQLVPYDFQKVATRARGRRREPNFILRDDIAHCSPRLFDAFRGAEPYWNEQAIHIHVGKVLTGEKLIDNLDYRKELVELVAEAIGGEMEGRGLYVACQDKKVDWILVKAISDWADGKKRRNKKARQELAALNAAKYILHVLQSVGIHIQKATDLHGDVEDSQANMAINSDLSAAQITLGSWEESKGGNTEDEIPFFVNRTDELREIMNSSAPGTHYKIDGPAGFGKTKMLMTLETKFNEHNYLTARLSVKENPDILTIVITLCKTFKLDKKSVIGDDGDKIKIVYRLGQKVLSTFFPDPPAFLDKEGVVLLIDDVGPKFPEATRDILEILIPGIDGTLRTNPTLVKKTKFFRVIIAGRYLVHFVNSLVPKMFDMAEMPMKAFKYEYVLDTARQLFNGGVDNIEQISAVIMHITGGHPGSMGKALNFYNNNRVEPEKFLRTYSAKIWNEIVSNEVQTIRDSIPNELRPICDRLSVFRVFNVEILKRLMEKKAFSYGKDEFELQDDLGATFLYDTSNEDYVTDAIVRRMLVLHLRNSDLAANFFSYCEDAYKECKFMLEQGMEEINRWAAECFYQALQKEIDSISEACQRKDLKTSFFKQVIPDVLNSFIKGKIRGEKDPRAVKQKIKSLTNFMRNDWELAFTVNFFLRADTYSVEEPFSSFLDAVEAWRYREGKHAKSKSRIHRPQKRA